MRNIINVGITFHGLQSTCSFLFNPHTHPKAHAAIPIVNVATLRPRGHKARKQYPQADTRLPHKSLRARFPIPALLDQPQEDSGRGQQDQGASEVRPTRVLVLPLLLPC